MLQSINPLPTIYQSNPAISTCHKISFQHAEHINQLNKDISKAMVTNDLDDNDSATYYHDCIEDDMIILQQNLDNSTLSVDQKPIIEDLLDILLKQKHNIPTKQFLGLLTGEPGTGKTFIIRTILKYNDEDFNVGSIVTAAYNGITAVVIDGQTLCSLFNIQSFSDTSKKVQIKPLSTDQLHVIQLKLKSPSLSLLIIDEISNVDPATLAVINLRLQQIKNNKRHFGGLNVIFVGDFMQLPPTARISFPELLCHMAVKKYSTSDVTSTVSKSKKGLLKPNSLSCIGCNLFTLFKRYHLVTQQRAKDDPEHFDFIIRLSNGEPIDLSNHLSRYKLLSKSDIESEPEKWEFSPFLVATNQERIQISYHQVKSLLSKITHISTNGLSISINGKIVLKYEIIKNWLNVTPCFGNSLSLERMPI